MDAPDAHTPVLLEPFVDALCTDVDGRYVDATFGRGGHARALLSRLSPHGRVLGIDRDPDAVRAAASLADADSRFSVGHAPFSELAGCVHELGWEDVHGVGFDLGISSPQVDDAARGFSFRSEGPLDMRMDPTRGRSLARRLERVSEDALARIIRDYGGERYARRLARAILRARREGRLVTTLDLENACFHAVPRRARHGDKHPATRTFQALRMWVNEEPDEIRAGVEAAVPLLRPGGRLAVISFHSGEDRLVRDLVEAEVNPCVCPPEFPVCACGRRPRLRWVRKKPLRASEAEIEANPRARSAMLRVAERLPEPEESQ